MIKLIDPTRPNEQHARGLDLHLLEVGKDNNRNVLEMVKAGKNQIKVPTSFEDYLTLTQGFMTFPPSWSVEPRNTTMNKLNTTTIDHHANVNEQRRYDNLEQ